MYYLTNHNFSKLLGALYLDLPMNYAEAYDNYYSAYRLASFDLDLHFFTKDEARALVIADKLVKDIKFVGTGCSISLASASMLTEELKGLSVSEANLKIKDFLNMIMGNDFNEDNLEDSLALQNISQLPARVKCATLAWKITEKILEENNK